MILGKYELINENKVLRALNGSQKANGEILGGVKPGAFFEDGVWKFNGEELPKKEAEELEKALLAEYDKLGGAIFLISEGEDGEDSKDPVKTGSFYDFKAKKARQNPEVVTVFRINGKVIEVKEGQETPRIVKAQKELERQEKEEGESEEETPKKGKGRGRGKNKE